MIARLNLVNGAAAAWTDTVNLSNYIGGLAVFTDTAGKKLWGHIKAADIAEAFDATKITNGSFTVDNDPPLSWTFVRCDATTEAGGQVGNYMKMVCNTIGGGEAYQRNLAVSNGQLCLIEFYYNFTAPDAAKFDVYDLTNGGYITAGQVALTPTAGAWVKYSFYFTQTLGNSINIQIRFTATNDTDILGVDEVSFREVTHLGTDAVTIVSTFEGPTFNWTGMDVGFDPNDIAIALIIVMPFEIIRHPHFVHVKNLYSGAGGNIDVDHHLLFKGSSRDQGVKVKRISFSAGHATDFIVIKEGGATGPEICRLGRGDAWVPDNCYFKNGGSVMKPFIDVSACTLYGWTQNRIIFDFDN